MVCVVETLYSLQRMLSKTSGLLMLADVLERRRFAPMWSPVQFGPNWIKQHAISE